MSGFVDWIGAQADEPDPEDALNSRPPFAPADERTPGGSSPGRAPWQELPAHDFPQPVFNEALLEDDPLDRNPDLWLYRSRTVALLRRYMRLSMETGRLPSVIAREVFRAKITTYTATTFEDRVIFVHDVEVCLDRLTPFDQKIIARIILQEYDHERAARALHCTRKTIERRLPQILDELSEVFLEVRMLVPLPGAKKETL
jgi:DNA-directed RNA polymerase specialized sigma24 family protein